jgi:hypothetical protein
MPRPYSEKLKLYLIREEESDRLGIQLAQVCVKARIPTTFVASTMNVSRQTVHNWFRGKFIREKRYEDVKQLYKTIKEGLEVGELPAITHEQGQEYIVKNISSNL